MINERLVLEASLVDPLPCRYGINLCTGIHGRDALNA